MKSENITINTEYIKLDSLLKLCGAVNSGGNAKEYINSGKIQVNGEACTMRGKKIYPGMSVTMGDKVYNVIAEK